MIPRTLNIAHTTYLAVLVPVYWRYWGPRNFLWFSDLALIGLVPALWREHRRLMSVLALSTVLPEVPWNVGFFARLLTGRELFGLSHYIFDKKKPLWLRALSLFHVWMPPLLLWGVRRLGYDRRALATQIVAGEAVFWRATRDAPSRECQLGIRTRLEAAEENPAWVVPVRGDARLSVVRLVAGAPDSEAGRALLLTCIN